MKTRFVPLAIALTSLIALGVVGALTVGSGPSEQPAAAVPPPEVSSTAPSPAPAADASVPAAQPVDAAPSVKAAEDTRAPAAPVTGCGKAVPCPNRDCADCPHNIYLK